MKILIHNATIVNEGRSFAGSVLVEDNTIRRIFATADSALCDDLCTDAQRIDASGRLLLPGVIDTHVHFRDPGLTHKGSWHSESRAAAAGGVTTVADMPNTFPPTTTLPLLREKLSVARREAVVNAMAYLGATSENLPNLAKLTSTDAFAVKLFMGSSTGNMLLRDERLLTQLFAECPLPIVAHCENEDLVQRGLEQYCQRYGEHIPFAAHPHIRSTEACYVATAKAIELAQRYGARLHIAHVSTARELSLLDKNSKQITAETCPHYLWFCDEDYAHRGALLKCNPAIKTAADRAALRCAVSNGLLKTVATDHAPHTLDEKRGSYLNVPSGMPLVQHALPAMLELARLGAFSIEAVVERMCHAPARIFGIARRGFIREGYAADLTVVNPRTSWTVAPSNIQHQCGWSAFDGCTFSHRVERTFVNGKEVEIKFSSTKK
jgi:dihydroorotase